MSDHEPSNVDVFLRDRSKDLRRIARATKGDLDLDELMNEAWLMAMEIGARRESPIDFADLDDQEQVLTWLYVRLVKRGEKQSRYAVRLDEGFRDDGGEEIENTLLRLLAAPEASDPLVLLQTTEEQKTYLNLVRSSFSQATAYVLVLLKMGRNELADFLAIGRGTLASRIHRAANWFKFQPSMFDGIEFIDEDFMPTRGRERAVRRPAAYVRRTFDLWPSQAWT